MGGREPTRWGYWKVAAAVALLVGLFSLKFVVAHYFPPQPEKDLPTLIFHMAAALVGMAVLLWLLWRK